MSEKRTLEERLRTFTEDESLIVPGVAAYAFGAHLLLIEALDEIERLQQRTEVPLGSR